MASMEEILRELQEQRRLIEEMKRRQEMYQMHPPESLTFDDVTLASTKESAIHSRKDVFIESEIAPGIKTSVAGICVTYMEMSGREMAIEAARNGCYCQLSRLMVPEEQVEAIKSVKRSDRGRISRPYEVYPYTTIGELRQEQADKGVHTFLVVDGSKSLVGIVTSRDAKKAGGDSDLVGAVMTPLSRMITVSEDTDIEEAKRLIVQNGIQQVPVVEEQIFTGEGAEEPLYAVKGLVSLDGIEKMENPIATRDAKGRLAVGGTIGLPKKTDGSHEVDLDELIRRVGILADAEADSVTFAVANGNLSDLLLAVRTSRANFPKLPIMAGTVDDHRGAYRLFKAGADTALIGIGPGAACETRGTTGVGLGQMTALRLAQRAKERAREELGRDVYVLADGGVSAPHHLVKAHLAGANGVSMGRLFADTEESASERDERNGKTYIKYRGLAAKGPKAKFAEQQGYEIREVDPGDLLNYVYRHVSEEGIEESWLPLSGPMVEKVRRIAGGLRSAMSYMNSRTLEQFRQTCDYGVLCECDRNHYMRVTDATRREGEPHDVGEYIT